MKWTEDENKVSDFRNMQVINFYTPRKRQKTKGFLLFSGSIEIYILHIFFENL